MCIRVPFGYSFQTICTVIAYFEILISVCSSVLVVGFGALALASPISMADFVENHSNIIGFNEIDSFLQANVSTQCAILTLILLYCTGGILLGILLLDGAQRRQFTKLKIWFVVQCIFYFLRIFVFICWLYYAQPGRRADVGLCSILINLYAACTLSTVKYFVDEVKCESICHRGKMTIT